MKKCTFCNSSHPQHKYPPNAKVCYVYNKKSHLKVCCYVFNNMESHGIKMNESHGIKMNESDEPSDQRNYELFY